MAADNIKRVRCSGSEKLIAIGASTGGTKLSDMCCATAAAFQSGSDYYAAYAAALPPFAERLGKLCPSA